MFTEHLTALIDEIRQQSASSAECRRLAETSSVKSLHSEMSRRQDENTELTERLTTKTDMILGDASVAQHDELRTGVVHSYCDMV